MEISKQSLKPVLSRSTLKLLSGLTWSFVGLLVGRWAWVWLQPLGWREALPYALMGALLAGGIQFFFAWMAWKNIDRIEALPERPCLFAFQSWRSYPLAAFMITVGLLLRDSLLPRRLLAILYLGIGGGLFAASLRYYFHLLGGKRSPLMTRFGGNFFA